MGVSTTVIIPNENGKMQQNLETGNSNYLKKMGIIQIGKEFTR